MNGDYTHISVIFDRTGSMQTIRDDTIGGFNVYDNDAAEHWAEEEMLHEALNHWDKDGGVGSGSSRSRRYQWWNRPQLRDLMTEQQLFAYEIAEKLKSKTPRRRSKTGR